MVTVYICLLHQWSGNLQKLEMHESIVPKANA